MRWKIFLGLFGFLLIFILTFNASALEDEISYCVSDSDGFSYSITGGVSLDNGAFLQDFCLSNPNENYLVEFTCNNGQTNVEYYQCPSICNSGRCASTSEEGELGEFLGDEFFESEFSYIDEGIFELEELEEINQASPAADFSENGCKGCLIDEKCYTVGQRFKSGEKKNAFYCGAKGIADSQEKSGYECKDNYECISNACFNNQCRQPKEVLSGASFLERGLLRLSCLFKADDSRNSCIIEKAQNWGIV